MAQIAAGVLVDHLELSGFVVMKKPPAPADQCAWWVAVEAVMVGLERAAASRGAGDAREFLAHMEGLAGQEPCMVPRADMLRLVELAGFNRTHLAWAQIEEADDPVLVLGDGLLELIAMAGE